MKLEDAWYIEWLDHTGALRWSGFIEGYEAAWAKFIELDQAAGVEELALQKVGDERVGSVRVGGPKGATVDELMSFDDAGGFGPEPFIGYEDAVVKLGTESP